jgi:3-hydroxyisobutyrate dehydrogenase
MVGGEKPALEKILEILQCYSLEVQHMGEAGAGQHTKVAN